MPDNAFHYCLCECGQEFQTLNAAGDDWDRHATMSSAYAHYVVCPVAFEQAPQLIVAMAETFRQEGWDLPKATS